MIKQIARYLGLGPDSYYENIDESRPAPQATQQPGYPVAPVPQGGVTVISGQSPEEARIGQTVRPVPIPNADGRPPQSDEIGGGQHGMRTPRRSSVEPHDVSPDGFKDAQEIGDRFKSGQPVIVNLEAVDKALCRRLVDFSSGLCYALGGKMKRVSGQVYLLTPPDVHVSR